VYQDISRLVIPGRWVNEEDVGAYRFAANWYSVNGFTLNPAEAPIALASTLLVATSQDVLLAPTTDPWLPDETYLVIVLFVRPVQPYKLFSKEYAGTSEDISSFLGSAGAPLVKV